MQYLLTILVIIFANLNGIMGCEDIDCAENAMNHILDNAYVSMTIIFAIIITINIIIYEMYCMVVECRGMNNYKIVDEESEDEELEIEEENVENELYF